jgi:5-formyltetrahydrofolate cyclo-ligase
MAFDRFGGRLGQGGGYYDRTLAALRAGPGVLAVGLGFAVQEIDEVPRDPHDEFLDAICTEIGYRRVLVKDP